MRIARFVCGVIEENGYVIWNEEGGECYVIDPGDMADKFLHYIKGRSLNVKAILLTHHHPDHTGAVGRLTKELNCPVFIHEFDKAGFPEATDTFKDGDVFDLDGESIKAVLTPGHTKGSVCFYCEESKAVFTGDTVFKDEVGRSDLPDSGRVELAKSLGNIVKNWPDDFAVYPGHGDVCDMAHVKNENPDFLQAMKRYDCYYADIEPKKPIKLIALDLDGTTLTSDITLPEENRKAFEEAVAKGVSVVAASGRCFSALPEEVTGIDGVQYAVSSNGAQVHDMRSGKIIHSNCMDPAAVKMLHDIIVENGYDAEVFVEGYAYMERETWQEIMDGRITFRRREYIKKTRKPIDNLMQFMLDNDDKIENVNIFFDSMDVKPAIRKTLEPLEPIATVTTSFDLNWEVGSLTTSKAGGIRVLCEILGIEMDEVMSFGDSPNDIPMIEEAGMGVAVENAKDSVKAVADFVTTSNDDAGVAVAVRKFVLDR